MRRRILASLEKSGGWVNPYVTDGLVAMWDGEWNAGGGVHDPNATVWKDLDCKGYDFTIPEASTIGKLNIKLTRGAGPVTIPSTDFKKFTYEFCGKGTGANIWLSNNRSVYSFLMTYSGGHFYIPWINIIYNLPAGYHHVVFTHDEDSKLSVVYVDGDEKAVFEHSATRSMVCNTLYLNHFNTGNESVIDYNRVAIYNSAMDAEQVAANYEIDKARFNLPDAT